MSLSIPEIKAAKPGQILWDNEGSLAVKGLHLRVNANGTKSFLLYYVSKQGNQRRPKIGVFGQCTLAEARSRAKMLMSKVAVGEDPKGEWDEKKKELTVNDMFEKTKSGYWSQDRFKESKWGNKVENFYKNHIKDTFGNTKLSEVTPNKVRNWHDSVKEKALHSANRSLEVLTKIFNYAEQTEIRPVGTNPCAGIKHHTEVSRERFATIAELKKLTDLLDKEMEHSPRPATFLYVMLYTGSRPIALRRAKWSQVRFCKEGDEQYGVLTFKGKTTAKTGKQESVVLPPQIMKMLLALPAMEDGSLLGIKLPERMWQKIRKKAGCTDLWARDFRRTFATLAMSGGENIGTIAELLNHKSTQTTKIYAKLMDETKVKAALRIADKIETMLSEAT